MNFDPVLDKIHSQVVDAGEKAQASIAANANSSDPLAMTKVQRDLNNLTVAANLESTFMKTIKDLFMSIISKI